MPLDGNTDDWEGVWADYDARNTGPDALVRRGGPTTRDASQAAAVRPSARSRRWLLLPLLLLLAALAWVLPPWIAANRFVEAVETATPERVVKFADLAALEKDAAAELNARIPAGLEPGAADFLWAMAGDMRASWAEPEALAAWLRLRRAGAFGFEPVLPPLGGSEGASGLGWTRAQVKFEGGVGFELRVEGQSLRWVGIDFVR
ncbi:hypothetical protein [Roseomonas elaeocarpi]|uniref:DUF2939 domain-containing protein n=1 Tax=Roseomonas elaeocarpi TaxID=907779 RepID=A0ABV6JWB8_9PROT